MKIKKKKVLLRKPNYVITHLLFATFVIEIIRQVAPVF